MEADAQHQDDAARAPMRARDLYELWLALVRGELTDAEAAERYGLAAAAVQRLRQVAEQGALAALAASGPDATAQVVAPTGPADRAGSRVLDLLVRSPVLSAVPRTRLAALARAATLAFLGARTPVADLLAAAPLLVAEGTLLVVDARDRPTDLIGEGAFRAARVGRRLVPLTATRVAALPGAVVADAAAGTRGQLAAGSLLGAPLGRTDGSLPAIATMVAGDLTTGDVVAGAPTDGALVDGGAAAEPAARARHLRVAAGMPLLDVLVRMLETGVGDVAVAGGGARGEVAAPDAATGDVAVADGAATATTGTFSAGDLPLPTDAGLVDLLAGLAGAGTVHALAAATARARNLVRALLAAGADIADAGRVLAAVADGLIGRLLAIAVAELGAPPGDFAWLVFGSHARREQTLHSDQDTGLVHASGLDVAGREWFAGLGEWMTQALEVCGYRRCPGGVMAAHAQWRHDLPGWSRTIHGWANPADATRLVGVDIGFDVRAVAGAGALAAGDVDARFSRMVADATRSELTAARLARAAVAQRPPSPLWGRVGRNPLGPGLGSRHRRFDLKRHGVQPIVDLARLYTLVRGGTEVGTAERLAAAAAEGQLSPDLAATLVEGLRLLTWARLSAQLGDGVGGAGSDGGPGGDADRDDGGPGGGDGGAGGGDGGPDNDVDWAALSSPLRAQFSDTFAAIRVAQDALRGRHRLAPGT